MKLKNFKELLDYVEENIKIGRNDTIVLSAEAFLIVLKEIELHQKRLSNLERKVFPYE